MDQSRGSPYTDQSIAPEAILFIFFSAKKQIFSLFLHKTIFCGNSLSSQGTSNEYPQHMGSSRNKKNIYLIRLLSRATIIGYVGYIFK